MTWQFHIFKTCSAGSIRSPRIGLRVWGFLTGLFATALFPAISGADISFADTVKAGGTIHLSKNQTYTGSAHITRDTTVFGNGALIQLSGSESISVGNGVSVIFENFAISGGQGIYINNAGNEFVGRSLNVSGSSSNGILAISAKVSLYGCVLSNIRNPNGVGYGLSIQKCAGFIMNNCTVRDSDMGLYLDASWGARIEKSTFSNCRESEGILVHRGSSATLLQSTITGCESGVAITENSTAIVDQCALHRNYMDRALGKKGQGIYVMAGSNLIVKNTLIDSNDNEGIYAKDSMVSVQNSQILQNGWVAKDGNGINLDNTPGEILDTRVNGNYLFGIQALGHDALIRGCEIRSNRLGGLHVRAASASQKQRIYGCILDRNTYPGLSTFELNCNGELTNLTANNNFIASNPNIGIYCQKGSFANLTGNLITSNSKCNINIYKADVALKRSVVAHGASGLFLNTAPDSAIHENDILYCAMGVDIMPGTGTTTDFTRNWWGSVSGPFITKRNPSGTGTKVSWNIDEFKPWEMAPVSYYAVFQNINLSPGATKTLRDSKTMPFVKISLFANGSATGGIVAVQASRRNLFPHLPASSGFPAEGLYLWVNACQDARTKTSLSRLELNGLRGVLPSLAYTRILKHNPITNRWAILNARYFASSDTLQVDMTDIQGCYLVFAESMGTLPTSAQSLWLLY